MKGGEVMTLIKAKVYFSDSTILELEENQLIFLYSRVMDEDDEKYYVVFSDTTELWSHHHDGIVPDIEKIIENYVEFSIDNHSGKHTRYRTSAVVKIESLY